MSLNIGQIYIQTQKIESILDTIPEYMKYFVQQNKSLGLPDGRLLSENRLRSLLVLPVLRGWVLILEEDSKHSDPNLAASVSNILKCRAVGLEVYGNIFNAKIISFASGQIREVRSALTEADERSEILPQFQDAELWAWEQAVKMDLPRELLLQGEAWLTPRQDAAVWQHAQRFVFSIQNNQVRMEVFKIPLRKPLEQNQPPVVFDHTVLKDSTSVSKESIISAIESRFLWGRSEPKQVEKYVAMLRRLQARYSRNSGLPLDKIRFLTRCGVASSESLPLPVDLAGANPNPESGSPTRSMRKRFED